HFFPTRRSSDLIQGAQINFLGSYNIIKKHLSIEFGPVFDINGKMKLDQDEYEDYILTGYNTLTAKNIQEISRFNVRLAGGITAGLRSEEHTSELQSRE